MLKLRCLAVLGLALLCLAWTVAVSADTHQVEMPFSGEDTLGAKGVWCRLGQRLTMPDRYVTEIGYKVWRVGAPTGNVTLAIYNATTDEPIVEIVWGDASQLFTLSGNASKVTKIVLDKPIRIDGDVRLFVEFHGGDEQNYCIAGYWTGDKVTGGWYTNYYHYKQWHDIGEAEEGSYYYAWIDEEDLKSDSAAPMWIIAPIAVAVGGIGFYVSKKQHGKKA
jgi:hypothetical protein